MKLPFAFLTAALLLTLAVNAHDARAQARTYPDKIRGYKVERAVLEVKRPSSSKSGNNGKAEQPADDSNVDQLITFGKPTLARVTPLGITFEVPVVVAPVTQSG